MNSFISYLQSINLWDLGLMVLFMVLGYLLRKAQTKPDNFDLRDLFIDPVTNKVSLSKMSTFVALILTSWVFVYLTIHDRLTETFYLTYLAVWTGYSGILHGISAYASKDGSSATVGSTVVSENGAEGKDPTDTTKT